MAIKSDKYAGRTYSVIPYDPTWPALYMKHVRRLQPIFGTHAVAFEHVGSTAVPGLAGKPIIDILILVDNIALADQLVVPMTAANYHALGDYLHRGSRLFTQETDGKRLCNIHVFQKDDTHAAEMIRVRNFLRSHPEEVQGYTELKFALMKKFPDDYASYRREKDAYMEGIVERSR